LVRLCAGRFSTDLDFAAPDEKLALSALQALDGVEIDGFAFAIENLGDDGRRGAARRFNDRLVTRSWRRGWRQPVARKPGGPRRRGSPARAYLDGRFVTYEQRCQLTQPDPGTVIDR
jgi:hypothetical protein